MPTKKTVSKKTASKTTKTTKSAKVAKTPRAKTATQKKSAEVSANDLQTLLSKGAQAKSVLLDQAATLGLLNTDDEERLQARIDALVDGSATQVNDLLNWDRAFAKGLDGVAGTGSQAKRDKTWEALLVWQSSLVTLSPNRAGLTQALEDLRRVLPNTGAALYLRDAESERVVPFINVGGEVELISKIRFAEGMGFSSWVATRKKPVLYTSLHRNEAPDPERMHSFISVPLVVGDTCVGVLNLGHAEDGFYTQNELRVAIIVGNMLAGLVQRVIALVQIATREIEHRASGFATQPYFRRRLDEEVTRCRELGHSMSVVVLRMNEWDDLRSQFGGEYGDRCWTELGEAIRGWAKPTELVGHLEGEGAVAILFPSVRGERATARASELVSLLERHNFPRRKRMTITWGVSAYPTDSEDSQGLLAAADKSGRDDERQAASSSEVVHTVALS